MDVLSNAAAAYALLFFKWRGLLLLASPWPKHHGKDISGSSSSFHKGIGKQ